MARFFHPQVQSRTFQRDRAHGLRELRFCFHLLHIVRRGRERDAPVCLQVPLNEPLRCRRDMPDVVVREQTK